MNPIKGSPATSARLGQVDRRKDRESGFADVLGQAESRTPSIKAEPNQSRFELEDRRDLDADSPASPRSAGSEAEESVSRELEARARPSPVPERDRQAEQDAGGERDEEAPQKDRVASFEGEKSEQKAGAGRVFAEDASPPPARKSRAGSEQDDAGASGAADGGAEAVPSLGAERPVRAPVGFSEPSWAAYSAPGGAAFPGAGAAAVRAGASNPPAAANTSTVAATALGASPPSATQPGVAGLAPSVAPAGTVPSASPGSVLPGLWTDFGAQAGDAEPGGTGPWGSAFDAVAIRAPGSPAASSPFGGIAGLATAVAAAPDEALEPALALMPPAMPSGPVSLDASAALVTVTQSLFGSALVESQVDPGPPLPKQLTFEVEDPRGAWTLEVRDHGRSLDVLIRGHASMAPVVAAAAADLRASLQHDGQTLGMLEFIAADAGQGRGAGAEGGERASPRPAKAPARSEVPGASGAPSTPRVGGRIDRIA